MTVDLETRILKQVEFYFGDANLPRDKFLRGKVGESEEGWVSLETIAGFARIQSLTEAVEVVKAALSKPSEVIVLGEDQSCVRRKHPLPETQDTIARTLYVKGFPAAATLDELQEFFAQHSGHVQAIRFRRDKATAAFKGSVFVEFSSEEEASKFAVLDVSYGEQKLVIKTKLAYFSEKNSQSRSQKNDRSKEVAKSMISQGSLVKILDCPAAGVSVNGLKDSLKDSFPVAFADMKHEANCIWIRFREACAQAFIDAHVERPLEVGDHKFSKFSVPSEEEYLAYCDAVQKAFDSKKRTFDHGRNKRPAGRGAEGSQIKKAKEEVAAESAAEPAADQ